MKQFAMGISRQRKSWSLARRVFLILFLAGMADIRASGGVGFVASLLPVLGSGFAYVTEQVRKVLAHDDLLELDPSALTVDYIKAVRYLSWKRAQLGPPWPWPLEPQFKSSAKEMRTKGEAFCALPLH